MPRERRLIEPGGHYHVGSRGSNSETIYWDPFDRRIWLRHLELVARQYEWLVLAFCEMTNHYHLIVRVLENTLSAGMQVLNGVYSRRTNARHGRHAHLFENRFWSRHLATQEHFIGAFRYADLNPVEARLCDRPEDWPWGSHGAIAGYRHAPPFLAVGEVLRMFHPDPAIAAQRYRELVAVDVPGLSG